MDVSEVRSFRKVKKGYTVFRDGDVLFAKITPCMENGKMVVARGLRNGVGCGSTEFHVLRPRPDVDPHYVYHFVSSARFRAEAAHHMTGAVGQKRVPATFLERSEIPLPALSEQRRIVAEIEKQFSRIDEAAANLRRAKGNLKRYKAALLRDAFEGRLVATEAELAQRQGCTYETGDQLLARILETRRKAWKGKAKYSEPPAPDTKDLRHLPEAWVWALIGQAFDVYVGATPSRANPKFWNGGIAWVSSGEVAFCRVRTTRETISAEGLANSSTTLHPAGTVLLGMIGEGKTRGQAAILEIEACNNQNSAAIRVSETDVLPEYIYYFLEKEYEDTRRRGSGGNQPALNKERVRRIPFPLPPVAEQQRIVREVDRALSIVGELEAAIDANLARARAIQQGILAAAFARANRRMS
jgi:type I restriction enzyme S subunit